MNKTTIGLVVILLLLCYQTASAVITQSEVVYGQEKLRVIGGAMPITTHGNGSITVNSVGVPAQTFKTISMVIPIGETSTYTETWAVEPNPLYETYLEYITVIRDENSGIDYYNFAVSTGGQLVLGGEIAPASNSGVFQPPIPINLSQYKNYEIVIRNKSTASVQKFKVGIILSSRKKN